MKCPHCGKEIQGFPSTPWLLESYFDTIRKQYDDGWTYDQTFNWLKQQPLIIEHYKNFYANADYKANKSFIKNYGALKATLRKTFLKLGIPIVHEIKIDDKKDRDEKIYLMHKTKMKNKDIASRVNLSSKRVAQIITRKKRQECNRKEERERAAKKLEIQTAFKNKHLPGLKERMHDK